MIKAAIMEPEKEKALNNPEQEIVELSDNAFDILNIFKGNAKALEQVEPNPPDHQLDTIKPEAIEPEKEKPEPEIFRESAENNDPVDKNDDDDDDEIILVDI
jgi:hypothetical protein